MHPTVARALAVLIAMLAIGTPSGAVRADAIGGVEGVARISYLQGAVDVVRADSGDTVAAAVNAPLAVGDTLITHADARAELELDFGTLVRVAPASQLRFSRIDTTDHRLQLALGSVEVRVFRKRGQNVSIEAPQATLLPTSPGRFRATVASNGDSELAVRSGRADVKTESGSRPLASDESLAVTGSYAAPNLRDVVAYAPDAFDAWSDSRDDEIVRAREAAYVDRDLVGAGDLDVYGHWIQDSRYGRVWSPYENASWAPYHDGRFVWEPYYGWTWVAAEPWGWAPYHYGNWFYGSNGWCWYPGSAFAPAFVYRPAVVAFVSFGSGIDFGFGNIGWVPLAPFEPFYPWYGQNATVINNFSNVNVYGSGVANSGRLTYRIYHNIKAPGGFVGLDVPDFANGRFARVDTVRPVALSHATVVRGVVPIVPTSRNLRPSMQAPVAATLVPSHTFARFAPPTMRVLPFARERTDIRAEAHLAYPTAPTVTTVVPHPNTFTIQQAMPPPLRTTTTLRATGFTHASDHMTRRPIVTILSNGQAASSPRVLVEPRVSSGYAERDGSPWNRFQGRAPLVVVGRPATTYGESMRDAHVQRTSPALSSTSGEIRGSIPNTPLHSTPAHSSNDAMRSVEHASAPRTQVEHEMHVSRSTIIEHASARTH